MEHHTSSLRFIIAVIIIVVLNKFFGVSLWWLAIPITIRTGKLIAGTTYMSYEFFGKTYTQGSKDNKSIALTFDDGPNKEYTPKILQILADNKITATFFLIGKNIEGNEDLVKRIDAEGHTIGNHTWSHSFLIDLKGKLGFMKELNRTADKVFSVTGKRMRMFRPPYGVTTPGLTRAYVALDYMCIGWTIRSFDTTKKTAEDILKRIEFGMEEGDVVLFHDNSDKTVNLLTNTITIAKAKGLEIVGLEKLFNIYAYE